MTAVLHRNLRQPEIADDANRDVIFNGMGEGRIDISSGAGVTCFGYSHPAITQAMKDQINRVTYVHSEQWTTLGAEALAELLIETATSGASGPSGHQFLDGRVMFLNTGAEAVEAACKLAAQYFKEVNLPGSVLFMGREHSYHGNTYFTMALGDSPRKAPYQRFSEKVHHFPMGAIGLRELERHFKKHQGPKVVVIETIGGTACGIEPTTVEYLAELRQICNRRGALLIYDEVLCGNYRTGEMWAWQHYARQRPDLDIAPDMIAMGKGLTGGYFPLSAVVVDGRIISAIARGSGRLWHSTTNQNHPIGCAAGVAAMQLFKECRTEIRMLCDVTERVYIPELLAPGSSIQSARGVGTLWGLQYESNRAGLYDKLRAQAWEQGLAIYGGGGYMDGFGNFILFAPPYNMGQPDMHKALGILRDLGK